MGSYTGVYICLLVLLLIIYLERRNAAHAAAKRSINKRRGGNTEMLELAKKFIDKECIIYSLNSTQITGTVKDVCDGALLIESKGTLEAVNLDFVIRIREYPKKKNGKKKSVVID